MRPVRSMIPSRPGPLDLSPSRA